MEIGFISIVLLKARVLNLTISKRKNLRFPFKVKTDQFVFCLVLPECLPVKICCISPLASEANRQVNRDGSDTESPFPLFFSLLRTLAREKRWKIVFVLGLVGRVSVCIFYCPEI